MKNIAIESVIAGSIFIVSVVYFGMHTFAGWFGVLAYSIAVGSIVFFTLFSPYGTRSQTTVFGYVQSYRRPVSYIPLKSAVFRLVAILACCAVAFGFYTYGK